MRLARTATGAGPAMVLLHGGGSGRGTRDAFTRTIASTAALPHFAAAVGDFLGQKIG